MKRFLIIAALGVIPFAAHAAIPAPASGSSSVRTVEKQVRLADYYKGKKHCYTRGSATICN